MRAEPGQLRGARVFRDLSDQDLALVAEWTEIRRVAGGEPVVSEGASDFTFYVIVEGSAVVRSDDREIATLTQGDHFGEMAIQERAARRADVLVTSPSTLGVMAGNDFLMMERAFPAVAARIRREADARRAEL
jgi:CRP-like cAMP-binding protein